jgi:hypothetical protein
MTYGPKADGPEGCDPGCWFSTPAKGAPVAKVVIFATVADGFTSEIRGLLTNSKGALAPFSNTFQTQEAPCAPGSKVIGPFCAHPNADRRSRLNSNVFFIADNLVFSNITQGRSTKIFELYIKTIQVSFSNFSCVLIT